MSLAIASTNEIFDSLVVLLQKAKAISTVNAESLEYIKSRQGQQVITHIEYTLEFNMVKELEFVAQKSKKDIDRIIKKWRYKGKQLNNETTDITGSVDLSLYGFADLVRLHEEFERLLQLYSRVFSDQPESRKALKVMLKNLEILQVAIGDVHVQTLDVKDEIEGNERMKACMNTASDALQNISLQGILVNLKINSPERDLEKQSKNIVLKCIDTLKKKRGHRNFEHFTSLEPYIQEGIQYLASIEKYGPIKLWNMQEKSFVAELDGDHHNRDNSIICLNSFEINGDIMLVTADIQDNIKVWNLSSKDLVHEMQPRNANICGLQSFVKNEKVYILIATHNRYVEIYDATNNFRFEEEEGCLDYIHDMKVFYQDSIPYMAIASEAGFAVYCLTNYEKVEIQGERGEYYYVSFTTYKNDVILASGNCGSIDIWNFTHNILLQSIEDFPFTNERTCSLGGCEFFTCKGRVCLAVVNHDMVYAKMDVLEKPDNSLISMIGHPGVCSVRSLNNYEEACLLSGHADGCVNMWKGDE